MTYHVKDAREAKRLIRNRDRAAGKQATMDDVNQITAALIEHGNLMAIHALRQASVPLARAQKIILSLSWRKEHKTIVSEKVKLLEKKGQSK
jgi:hypothetical protein